MDSNQHEQQVRQKIATAEAAGQPTASLYYELWLMRAWTEAEEGTFPQEPVTAPPVCTDKDLYWLIRNRGGCGELRTNVTVTVTTGPCHIFVSGTVPGEVLPRWTGMIQIFTPQERALEVEGFEQRDLLAD